MCSEASTIGADRCGPFLFGLARPFDRGQISARGAVFARGVAAVDFASEPGFECFDGVRALAKEVDALAPIAALPAPLPHGCDSVHTVRLLF
jgi:hypothetical protein